jgi:hypothetical protein
MIPHPPEKEPKLPGFEMPALPAGEQAEISDAVEVLREIGLLEPVSELDVYHGRVEGLDEAGQWAIDPDFDNAGNNSGNRNVNQRPTLYASGFDEALKFGQQRGASIVRDLVRERVIEHVGNYTGEQKQEWLDRLNREEQETWADMEKRGVDYDPGYDKPKVYKEEDLDEAQIRTEAFRLRREGHEIVGGYWEEEAQAYQVSVYAIESDDPALSILDEDFDLNALREDEQKENMERLQEALDTLAPDLDEMIPEELGSAGTELKQRVIDEFNHRLRRGPEANEEPTLSQEDVERISDDMELPADQVRILAGSLNARALWLRDATAAMNLFLGKHYSLPYRVDDDFAAPEDTTTYMDGDRVIPLNILYLSTLFQRAGIIGEEAEVKSATLGKMLKVVSFFDLRHLKATYAPAEKPAE